MCACACIFFLFFFGQNPHKQLNCHLRYTPGKKKKKKHRNEQFNSILITVRNPYNPRQPLLPLFVFCPPLFQVHAPLIIAQLHTAWSVLLKAVWFYLRIFIVNLLIIIFDNAEHALSHLTSGERQTILRIHEKQLIINTLSTRNQEIKRWPWLGIL